MGLISRVSSRTYRYLLWVFPGIHGTSAEKLEGESLKCTKSENLRWVDLQATRKFNQNVYIWFALWVGIRNSGPCVWITEILAGLVKVFRKRHVSSMSFTMPLPMKW